MSVTDPIVIDYPHGISAIDTEFTGKLQLDASHLVVDAGEAAFIDVGSNYSIPVLMAGLAAKGLAPEQVRYVCVTHVHLDHAGGAGEIMRRLPNALLVVHPRGARHMIDPTQLYEGAKAVYGEAGMQRQYGTLLPVPEARVRVVEDGERLPLGQRELLFLDTPGHAYHHYCVVDRQAGAIFAGDTFGLSYRQLDTARGPFIFPTTTPVHFDPEAAHASIDKLMSFAPRAIYLTHFSEVTDLARLAGELHEGLDALVAIARRHESTGAERGARIARDMRAWLGERLRRHGCALSEAEIDRVVMLDVGLNTQGLEVWLARQAA
jgi:glyoxylase-like metal-dependent hydrolase (beta-lactamase superfamily II)